MSESVLLRADLNNRDRQTASGLYPLYLYLPCARINTIRFDKFVYAELFVSIVPTDKRVRMKKRAHLFRLLPAERLPILTNVHQDPFFFLRLPTVQLV